MLGVVEVDVNADGQKRYDEDVQSVLGTEQIREPTDFGVGIDNTDVAGTLGIFPYHREVGNQLNGYIVHHKGEEGLIGSKFCLEESRNRTPKGAGTNTCDHHAKNDYKIRLILHEDHASGSCKGAGKCLTFAAQVPKAHLKSRRKRKGNAKQHSGILQKNHKFTAGTEGAVKDGSKNLNRIVLGDNGADQTAADQGKNNGHCPDAPAEIPGHINSLYNMKKRLFGLMHCCYLQDGSSSYPGLA